MPPALPVRPTPPEVDALLATELVDVAYHLHCLTQDTGFGASAAETRALRRAVVVLLRVYIGARPVTSAHLHRAESAR